ncbi:MAG: glycine cleavage system protein GcvH [Desulfobacteraceae bacterium]|jgi:glycine cleavage system H protein
MDVKGYNMPEDLLYEENHFWIKQEGDLLIMGMDDFAQKLAGEIVYVQLPDDGKKVKAGKKFAKVESGKWLGKVYAPVNGVIDSVNEALEENPGLINEDGYGKGWMFKIKPNDPGEPDNMIKGADAIEAWITKEIEKYAEDE